MIPCACHSIPGHVDVAIFVIVQDRGWLRVFPQYCARDPGLRLWCRECSISVSGMPASCQGRSLGGLLPFSYGCGTIYRSVPDSNRTAPQDFDRIRQAIPQAPDHHLCYPPACRSATHPPPLSLEEGRGNGGSWSCHVPCGRVAVGAGLPITTMYRMMARSCSHCRRCRDKGGGQSDQGE